MRLWTVQRRILQAIAGVRWDDISYLLSGWGKRADANSGKLLDGERDSWNLKLTVIRARVQYLQATGRLTYQPEEGLTLVHTRFTRYETRQRISFVLRPVWLFLDIGFVIHYL